MHASIDAASARGHTPVLYQNVLSSLNLRSGGRYIDGTVGAGGHAAGILEKTAPGGALLGFDRDPAALQLANRRLAEYAGRFELFHKSYAFMREVTLSHGWEQADGVLLDLGLSSIQLGDADRGFSFMQEGPLDMRFDPSQTQTAEQLVNQLPENDLRELLWRFGDEPRARAIASAIVRARPIQSTTALADVIVSVKGIKPGVIHPATLSFQALRIAVNEELDQLTEGLEQAISLLKPGGRLAVIAFHSLEDRIVKNVFRRESKDCICPPEMPTCECGHKARLKLITKRPIQADVTEIEQNPRARSARLRVAEVLSLA